MPENSCTDRCGAHLVCPSQKQRRRTQFFTPRKKIAADQDFTTATTSGLESGFAGGLSAGLESASFFTFKFAWFVKLCSFIGMVSAYDTYLVIKYHESILVMERNPVCRMLIRADYSSLSVFIGAKALGTLLVVAILAMIYFHNSGLAHKVASGLSLFQLGLLLYLTTG